VDGQQTFPEPTQFALPLVIPVTDGLSGTGTAVLTFHSASTCVDVTCIYHGASSVAQTTTIEDKTLGQMYLLQSCSDGSLPDAVLAVTNIGLHVVSGDTGTPRVEVQIVQSYPDDQGITVLPPPTDLGPLVPITQLADGTQLPPSGGDTTSEPYVALDLPSPDPSLSSPEVSGSFTPQADPDLVPLDPFGN
jgi:hypothetical protein